MDYQAKLKERIEIFDDAVRMTKRPKRVPFVTNDAFWRYYDLGYKLSGALLNSKSIEDVLVEFQHRYEFDLFLDIGDRNPLQMTRSLGNYEYNIDDKNNTLILKEQCFFMEEDYDEFVENPVKTLWENILPRKYSLFTPEMDVKIISNTLTKFLEYNQAMAHTVKRLIDECGVPPIFDEENGAKIFPAFECLYNFLRGMKGLSHDLRRCPEKVEKFSEVFHDKYVKHSIQNIKTPEDITSCFTVFTIMLSQNMINAKQFEKFYWPHFKEIADKVVETNNTMFILSEGTTKHVTEYLQELPKGHFCFYIEADDIFEARKRLPNIAFWGGLPLDIIANGTKQECIDYAKKVIDEVGRDGGLVLSTSRFTTSPKDCNRENLLAVSEFVRNYN
ncbi:MAG: uroporphyrinogen decarboxylase family protein [Eubacteriaceae bacterium]